MLGCLVWGPRLSTTERNSIGHSFDLTGLSASANVLFFSRMADPLALRTVPNAAALGLLRLHWHRPRSTARGAGMLMEEVGPDSQQRYRDSVAV